MNENDNDAAFLERLVGKWRGTCRTWFEPDQLADESEVEGEFRPVDGGPFVRHVYSGSIQGRPRHGEELIAFNTVGERFEVAWFDDFHMNYAIMFSQGESGEGGFTVEGRYEVGPGQPSWGWRTRYELTDESHLVITAYNIPPDAAAAKAVETRYARIR